MGDETLSANQRRDMRRQWPMGGRGEGGGELAVTGYKVALAP